MLTVGAPQRSLGQLRLGRIGKIEDAGHTRQRPSHVLPRRRPARDDGTGLVRHRRKVVVVRIRRTPDLAARDFRPAREVLDVETVFRLANLERHNGRRAAADGDALQLAAGLGLQRDPSRSAGHVSRIQEQIQRFGFDCGNKHNVMSMTELLDL